MDYRGLSPTEALRVGFADAVRVGALQVVR
jgi:hypothetical protein